jgi:hypothetical protein
MYDFHLTYLARGKGATQFLDIGPGIPSPIRTSADLARYCSVAAVGIIGERFESSARNVVR